MVGRSFALVADGLTRRLFRFEDCGRASRGLLFRRLGGVGDSIGSLAVNSDSWRHRSDAITSAFAFVGISITCWEGPDGKTADDWAALCAGVVILYRAWHQLRAAIFELADIAPDPDMTQSVPTRNECLLAIEHTYTP
jgi:divalent metal cation (Fe/Co/Zn/Cd) transporter